MEDEDPPMPQAMPKLRVVAGGAPSDVDHELPASDRVLFDRFAPYVARIALRLLGREAEIDDVVQEVLLAAFRQRDRIREPRAFRGWLATVTVRTARRKLRYRRMRSFVGLDTVPAVPELRDADIGPEKRASSRPVIMPRVRCNSAMNCRRLTRRRALTR